MFEDKQYGKVLNYRLAIRFHERTKYCNSQACWYGANARIHF